MSKLPFEDVTIEKVQRDDLDQLEKLFASAFAGEVDIQQIQRRIRRARQFYYLLHPLSKFSAWVKNHFNVYVVKVSEKVVGFIQISYLNPTQMHVDYIAFSKQYRGQGLGQWVLTKLVEDVVDANNYDVILEVRLDNPAYRLYRRFGFKQITEILHYEMALGPRKDLRCQQNQDLPGFREVTDEDRRQLYRLYKESVSPALRHVVKRSYGEFNPSMMVRHLDWAKNYLMRKEKSDYVVEQSGKIVALLTITSYLRVKSHVLSLIIHRDHEELRQALLAKAISLIGANHKRGTISTTIYSDDPNKQAALEQLGFRQELAYYLMFRPSIAKRKESIRAKPHKEQPMNQPALTQQ